MRKTRGLHRDVEASTQQVTALIDYLIWNTIGVLGLLALYCIMYGDDKK